MNQPKQIIVTTSWDDGHKLDVRLAALLKKYKIKGTFYVSPHDQEFAPAELLRKSQVKNLSKDFEIGAHTMTHPRLTKIDDDSANREIVESKDYLEKITGKKVVSFCYPGGNYTEQHTKMAADAGFTYARTVHRHISNLKGSLFEAGTTVNTYNHYQDLWKIAKFAKFNPIRTYRYFHWEQLAKAKFDQVCRDGGVFHLWGHSWEVDQHSDWEKLEDVLRYISEHNEVLYKTNGQLVDYQPKRVLMAAPYFPPHLGGVEFYAYHIAQHLQQDDGWYACVVTTGKRGLRLKRAEYDGLRIYYLPYWIKVSNTPLNPFWSYWFRKIIKTEDIYIINAHAPVPVFADLAARVAKRIPIVITYHMMSMAKGKSGPDKLIKMYEQYVLPATLNRAVNIICSSEKVRKKFLTNYRYKSFTITPGVDVHAFKPARTLAKDTILFVGSLGKNDHHKGVPYLLAAFQQVVERRPAAKLLVVGTGGGRPALEARAKQLGISKSVSFLGGKYGKDLSETYRQASMFVLPTLNDSYPLVNLEAMASGLPVISTRVGGIPTQVENDKTGYLLQPKDIDMLATKMIFLLENRNVAKAFGEAGREKVELKLTWNNQADVTHSVLLKAMHTYTENPR